MNILVLGGAGYIGSHTVWRLLQDNHSVSVVDNLVTGHRLAVHKDARFYQGDLLDFDFLCSVLQREKPDGIIHFAAFSQVGESMQNPLKYYQNNLCGTKVLCDAMVACGIKLLVFSSTAAVYGQPETTPILESDFTRPTNCYGETKLAMENMIRWVAKAHKLRFVALRYFNACGAEKNGQIGEAHSPESHLIPLVLQVANGQREQIFVYGDDYDTCDGTCIRDYIHVWDLATAHVLAMQYLLNGGSSDVFNLGVGVGFSVHQVISAAREVTGHPIPVQVMPRREGDPAKLVASSKKAQTVLGWQPTYHTLNQMIDTAWRWHKSHKNGYED